MFLKYWGMLLELLAHPSGPQDFHPDFCRFLWEKTNDRLFIMGKWLFPINDRTVFKISQSLEFMGTISLGWCNVEWRRSGWLLAWCMALRLARQFQMIETEFLQFPKAQVISGNLRSRVKRHRKNQRRTLKLWNGPCESLRMWMDGRNSLPFCHWGEIRGFTESDLLLAY